MDKVELNFESLWIEFEKFLEPHTCDEIIQPIYARNTVHIKNWLKSVCDRYNAPEPKPEVSEEEILEILINERKLNCRLITVQESKELAYYANAISQRLKGQK